MPLLRADRLRPGLALVLAGWLVVLAAETAPHLVHHLFATDDEGGCPYQAAADHAPAIAAVPAVVPAALPRPERIDTMPAAPVGRTPVRHGRPRAPPTAPPLALA